MLTLRTVSRIVYKGAPKKPTLDIGGCTVRRITKRNGQPGGHLEVGYAPARSFLLYHNLLKPSIKEYTLNHSMKAPIILGTFLN